MHIQITLMINSIAQFECSRFLVVQKDQVDTVEY